MIYHEIQEMCVHLNQLISQALFKHHIGDPSALQARDKALTEAKITLINFLDGLPKNPSVKTLVDLQTDLITLIANLNIYADEIPMEVIFKVNKVVSEALANHYKTENMELLITLNKEISAALINRDQMFRREKIQTIMSILSNKTRDGADKTETSRAFYRMKDVLVDTLAENSQDKKHELLLKLNILLSAYMATGHSDKDTEWLVKLNYYAALIMVKNFSDPTQLYLMNQHLAHGIWKTLPVDAIFKDLTQLNFSLSSIMISQEVPCKLGQMIEWKAVFADVMQEALEGHCLRYMNEQGTTVFKQVTFAEIECLKAQLKEARKEKDLALKAQDAIRKERDFLMEELKKSNPAYAGKRSDTTVPRDNVESLKPVGFDDVTHLRLRITRNEDSEEEEDEELPLKMLEGLVVEEGQSTSAEKTVVSGKGTEITEKKKAEEPGQKQTNAGASVSAATQKQVAGEAVKVGEEKKEEPPKVEKKSKTVFYTYAMPPKAKKDPRPKGSGGSEDDKAEPK